MTLEKKQDQGSISPQWRRRHVQQRSSILFLSFVGYLIMRLFQCGVKIDPFRPLLLLLSIFPYSFPPGAMPFY